MVKTHHKYIFLSLLILSFAVHKTYTTDLHIANPKPKVVTVSVKPLDELKLYNNTAFSITIVVHDANNENITYQVSLAPNETFYKNARCHTTGNKKASKVTHF